nr:hypothetical protein BaRGS_001960 [Batillaria attramentaria]
MKREAPSTAQLLEMVQKLTGRLEKVEEKGTLTDEVGKLGEAMTGAMEELGDKLGDKMNDVAATLGDTLTEGLEKFAETLHANANEKCLDNIHLLTTARNQTLRVELQDFDNNTAYAEYRFFAIDGPDSFYRLHVDGDSLAYHNNQPFSTHDSDHDLIGVNCAVYKRGAWWYVWCAYSNLNVGWEEDYDDDAFMGCLDNIHLLTTARNQTLRVDLQDFDNNTAYAEYRFFAIDGPDSFYRLHVDGNSMARSKSPFSTYDSDHDSWRSGNCAVDWHGAWWYFGCTYSNLNGPYLTSAQQNDGKSIYWHRWKHAYTPLKHVEMKIRPAM